MAAIDIFTPMTTERTETEAETEAAVIAALLAICDELIESGALNQDSIAAAFAAQALEFQSNKLRIAAGILETLNETVADDERRSFRKTLKEKIAGPPRSTT
ncbi:MAG: hypothetical protein PVJ83_06855 [Gammaproteobacteria bacterium]|jgi:hypothetical protein